jgi:serine/threonine protein kinase
MTFVEGETLETILKREGCLPPSRVLFYAIQLCEVLVYLHQQQPPVIHRDLKPANIIIDPKGDLWLIDFGIARYGQVAQHHQQVLAWRSEPRPGKGDTLPNLGTVGYAPPEQFGVPSYTTTRSDLYSFGAVLHHMLSGENPTQQAKKNLFTWRKLSIIPTRLGELIAYLLHRDPEQRPQSAADVLQVLEKLADPSREESGSVVP